MTDAEALTSLVREERGRVLALLARELDDLDLADDSVQEALVEAVRTWPDRGTPANPPAWLLTVARNKARDRLRRRASADRRLRAGAHDLLEAGEAPAPREVVKELATDVEIPDERLRLMLLCCHPALNQGAQVALTLRLVAGLTTTEIAAAFLVPEPAVTQRIVRAKRKIRDAHIPLSLPAELTERVGTLLTVLYVVFDEAHLSGGEETSLVRTGLADEAIRLTRLTCGLLDPSHDPDAWAEASGLLALELFQRARFDARTDLAGDLVLLADQDRSRWDRVLVHEANQVLASALRRQRPGSFQVQAVIAGLHANAPSWENTDWSAIADAYARLVELDDSPVVRLNQAVAVGQADGPQAGLRLLERVVGLERYHLLHAVRADLSGRAGDSESAAASYEEALRLVTHPVERQHLERRLALLYPRDGRSPTLG